MTTRSKNEDNAMMPRYKGHLNNGAADREELGLVTKRLQGKLKHGEKGGLAKEIFLGKCGDLPSLPRPPHPRFGVLKLTHNFLGGK